MSIDGIFQNKEYNAIMKSMEANATEMHNKVNLLKNVSDDIKNALKILKKENTNTLLISEGKTLLKELKKWDEQMVQRRSQAYDDVENFENKFSANYMFVMNQANGSLPKITQAVIDRKGMLDATWKILKQQADSFIQKNIPELNKKLWNAGIGAIQMK